VCTGAGYTDHGYGSNSGSSYWGADSGHNCTNYVAYVETMNKVPTPSFALGDAYQWWPEASGHITESTTTPVVGSVAWWGQNQGGVGSDGHVAYVENVTGSSGSYTISVSEDAYPSGPFDWMKISQGDARWPRGFIYFDNKSSSTLSGKAGIVSFETASSGGGRYMEGGSIGNGEFNWGYTNLTNMETPDDFALGDFNDDGRADLVAFEPQSGGGGRYMQGASENNGQFNWGYSNLNNMATPTHFALGDVNGDGKADIVAFEPNGKGGGTYMEGISQGNGQFSWMYTNLTNMAVPTTFALGDINGDHKADLVSFEPNGHGGGSYMVGISQGAGKFSWAYTNLTNMAIPTHFDLGDINGDHKADLVSFERNSGGGGNYMVGMSQGNGKFSWAYSNLKNWEVPTDFTVSDFTGDGKADLVAFEPNGQGGGSYMQGSSEGNGQFNWGYTNLTNMEIPTHFALGDFIK
jgi:surface antigen